MWGWSAKKNKICGEGGVNEFSIPSPPQVLKWNSPKTVAYLLLLIDLNAMIYVKSI